ncbi:Rpn family recombination-promoting nuclease/putative transposase [Desulfobacterales bacterium HSG16]|nr:Rpn family recombination-promoting nuclease/putative transposase [Desulfobacterales bacterium HSG16]
MNTEEKKELEDAIENPHDTAFKRAFGKKRLARSFFKHHLPQEILKHIDLKHLRLVNRSYVDEKLKQRHADVVYETRVKGRTAFLYLLFEHQSSPDKWMAFRLLCYMVNIWKEFLEQNPKPKPKRLPVIIPLVLYHGKKNWSPVLEFTGLMDSPDELKEILPNFKYTLFNLESFDDERIQLGNYMALHVVLNLFKHIYDDDFGDILSQAITLLRKIDDKTIYFDFMEWVLRYTINARDENFEELKQVIDREMERLGDERIRRSAMTMAQKIRQEGVEEGSINKALSMLLKQTETRFGHVSSILEKKLKQSNMDILDKFSVSIFDFKDIEDAEKWWDDQNFGSA